MSMHTQEPIGNFTGEFKFKFKNSIAYITVKCDDAIPEAGAKLYAHPVPAQQEDNKPKGINQYGLDASYFYGKLSMLLRDIRNYKPDEMARSLARLSITADEKVLSETEFTQAQQDYKAMCEELVILLKEIREDISRVQIGRYCDLEVSLLKISKAIAKAEKI